MAFRTQSIKFESLGTILRDKRISESWSLEDVEKKIGVPAKYLQCIEEDEFYKLPSPTYTRGFLLQYAELLRFNPEEVVNLWKKEYSYSAIKETKNKRVRKLPLVEFGKEKFFDIFNSRYFFIGLVSLGVLLYLFFGIKKLMFPPEIQLFSPRTNLVTQVSVLVIEGKVGEGVDVFINK
ncbi:MAG: helix-turn-helix domain-containing protein [Patescibacteria group bacterium]|nr:helix-turn-helix domain-containing protein [Patescibacteria group bacterium]